jgi:hypothetical protein
MEGRLEKILDRYLTRVSSITDIRVEGQDRLCATDLAQRRGVRGGQNFRYSARLTNGSAPDVGLAVESAPDGTLCVTLPAAGGGGPPDDAGRRYVRVAIEDGVAKGSLLAYLYDLGPSHGYALAGVERPEP